MDLKPKALIGGIATELVFVALASTSSFAHGPNNLFGWIALLAHIFPGMLVVIFVSILVKLSPTQELLVAGIVQLCFWVWLWHAVLCRNRSNAL